MTFYRPNNDKDRKEHLTTGILSINKTEYSIEIHKWLHNPKNMKHGWA